ncbi:TetR family transcriptional regulator [Nocardioides sp. Root1257]|uniref:TetR/AcrR family transcriptional regulator n=1 Tax=unclassified Nocardioides TaxID=2615069 RepID=UPI0006F9E047|nr:MULTISPECIES: TetR/AcrR family transcriptional regulator [unclassified Nocardioides]KQW47074.1 TetR family transcriptional regulator [Nocardioides sp. Root1257]KRC43819.1 TetR family transcriptional regulator [Nocardioides sp. Root224]
MTAGADQHRRNRRGDATRARMLAAALDCLASGDPDAVSANHVARRAGVTWGAVKYQFGDVDGLWAAVLDHLEERRGGPLSFPGSAEQSVEVRVQQIVTTLWRGLDLPDSRAIDTLRMALPRERAELEQKLPRTAAALSSWQQSWVETCQTAFADLDLDPDRVREVAALLPGAMRGLSSEAHLSTYSDLDLARRGLTRSIAAYLGGSPA